MESTVIQVLEGHSVFLTEDDVDTEYNPEAVLDPLFINVEPEEPTLPEFAFVKVESISEDPLYIENHPEIENLQESAAIKPEPTSPPGTPTHSTTLDNITSQLDQVTHESSKTQLQFHFHPEACIKGKLKINQCTVCNKVFSRKDHLNTHILIHSAERDHKCDACGKSFTTKAYLKKHHQTHKPGDHVCAHCNKTFPQRKNLNTHLLTHSKIRDKKCDQCDKCFNTIEYLKQHKKTHKRGAHVCPICSMPFATKSYLQNHVRSHSINLDKKCEECDKCFATSERLKYHQQIHKPDRYICSHCNKTFTWKCSLVLHLEHQHKCESDRTRYVCSICSKSYYYNSNLTAHLKTHNLQRCKICNLECADLPSLRAHMSAAHDGETKHRCKTCEKRFVTLEDLTKHEKQH